MGVRQTVLNVNGRDFSVLIIGRYTFRCNEQIRLGSVGWFEKPLGARGYIYKLNVNAKAPDLYNFVNIEYFSVDTDKEALGMLLSEPISSIKDVKRFLML